MATFLTNCLVGGADVQLVINGTKHDLTKKEARELANLLLFSALMCDVTGEVDENLH